MSKIYGVDLNAKITPTMVRDAIVSCFFIAHCEDTGMEEELDDVGLRKEYCQTIVMEAFKKTGGDFSNPSKHDIEEALRYLADFSQNFRNPSIIRKHSKAIMKLVDRLD